jgi:hypothetical protein
MKRAPSYTRSGWACAFVGSLPHPFLHFESSTAKTPTTMGSTESAIDIKPLSYDAVGIPLPCMDLSFLRRRLPLGLGVAHPRLPILKLGALDVLPTEILLHILQTLPLRDLLQYRNLSKSNRQFVDSIAEFSEISRYAQHTLRCIIAIQTTAEITLVTLYQALCDRHCDACGSLTQHIWLPTCRRICLRCPDTSSHGLAVPLTKSEILLEYELDDSQLLQKPRFHFIPSIFARRARRITTEGCHWLYDTDSVRRVHRRRPCPRADGSWALTYSNIYRRNGEVDYTIRNARHDGPPTMLPTVPPSRYRFTMATVVAPWLSPGKMPEMGLLCVTCRYTSKLYCMYTRTGFLEHLRECRVQFYDLASIREVQKYGKSCIRV